MVQLVPTTLPEIPASHFDVINAQGEISQLRRLHGVEQISRVGGHLSLQEVTENERRNNLFRSLWAETIKKWCVVSTFLPPLQDTEKRLLAELEKVQADIAALTT